MPSWLVASISVACSIAHKVVLAALPPAAAFGSICERRAEMTANSAPTKKALPTSSTTSQMIPGRYSFMAELLSQVVHGSVVVVQHGGIGRRFVRGVSETHDARAVDAVDPKCAVVQPNLVTEFGQPLQPCGHESTDGVVIGVFGHLDLDSVLQLIGSPTGLECHRAAGPREAGSVAIVLVFQL